MRTRTGESAEDACSLRELLDDAHRRIRELESRLDRFSDELLVLRLNDRRHSSESPGQVKHERRRGLARSVISEDGYRGLSLIHI